MTGRQEDVLRESPSQTAGPYLHIGCTPSLEGIRSDGGDLGREMWTGAAPRDPIEIHGVIYDGVGDPLRDAMVEFWQADAAGAFAAPVAGGDEPSCNGWARRVTDPKTGLWQLTTVKPGRVSWGDGQLQAPHISVWIVARGINVGLNTRLYFEDEPGPNALDPVLSSLRPLRRDETLLARSTGTARYHFDIRLQGPDETVFFDI